MVFYYKGPLIKIFSYYFPLNIKYLCNTEIVYHDKSVLLPKNRRMKKTAATPPGKSLFFVAVIAPEPVQSEITEMKQTAKELFGSGHALNAPAHMTLIPPFRATEEQIEAFADDLQRLLRHKKLPPVRLNGFDRFGNRVIFVDVEKNPRWEALQNEIYELFRRHFPRQAKPNRFHPHFTIAFRDLRPEMFEEAWSYFNRDSYEASFLPESIDILRHKNGKWHIFKKINK